MDIELLVHKKSFHYDDFADLGDEDFVKAAYAVILRREPDEDGLYHYTTLLKDGHLTRLALLRCFRTSPEGRMHGVSIKGIGNLFKPWNKVMDVVTLPFRIMNMVRYMRTVFLHVERLQREVRWLSGIVDRELLQPFPASIYWELEDLFRGPSREVEANLAIYLPLVRDCLRPGEKVLDLGCGRGEWLTLLRKNKMAGLGVDGNPSMIAASRQRGLEVIEADIMLYLAELPDASLSVVTAFHVVEHFSSRVMATMWEEVCRVLRPGGLFLFETPNPENLYIATYGFYLDPTHKKPVPPPLATYALKSIGFDDIRVIRSKPITPPVFGVPKLDEYFSVARDYAVVAYKDGKAAGDGRGDDQIEASPCNVLRSVKIDGPFTGSYSLALVNREIGLSLEATHPGRVGLVFDQTSSCRGEAPAIVGLHERGRSMADPELMLYNSYPPLVHRVPGALAMTSVYGWEESLFPQEFAQGFNEQLDGLTLASAYVRRVMQDNGIALPMCVVGEGVDHVLRLESAAQSGDGYHTLGKGFRFLHVSSCFPRKGLDILLEAYGEAFNKNDAVTLVIKTFPNPHNDAERQVELFRKQPDAPDVLLINEDVSYPRLLGLYKKCHCLVAPSRGEGFGLPMAEAMAIGLPVITTGYGGQTDFCTEETSWLIDYSFCKADTHLSGHGSVWVEPDVGHLASLLRRMFYADQGEVQAKIRAAKKLMRTSYTWQAAADRIVRFAGRLRRAPAEEPVEVAWVSTWNCRCGIAEYSKYLVDHLDHDRLRVTILAPKETGLLGEDGPDVVRGWTGDNADSVIPRHLDAHTTQCVVINHHPGFFRTETFGKLLDALQARGLAVVVIFHATKNGEKGIGELVPQLARVQRLLVHNIDDLNRLKELGLVDNVGMFPHGVLATTAKAATTAALPEGFRGGRILASYGFLMPHKGIAELIEAVAILAKKDSTLRLLLVNAVYPRESDQKFYEKCKSRIKKLGLEDRVHLVSEFLPVEESLGLLRHAEVIVYPYQQTGESSSAAVRMGLAADRPVACTDLPIFDDVRDVVHQLPGTQARDIAVGLRALLDDATRLHDRDAKRQGWLAHYDWVHVGPRLSGLVRSLVRTAVVDRQEVEPVDKAVGGE